MRADERTSKKSGCGSYDPGHLLHWHHWKQASAAECVAVLEVTQTGTSLEITVPGQPPLRWYHHDPLSIAMALAGDHGPILASPRHQALRINGYWFNCTADAAALAACG